MNRTDSCVMVETVAGNAIGEGVSILAAIYALVGMIVLGISMSYLTYTFDEQRLFGTLRKRKRFRNCTLGLVFAMGLLVGVMYILYCASSSSRIIYGNPKAGDVVSYADTETLRYHEALRESCGRNTLPVQIFDTDPDLLNRDTELQLMASNCYYENGVHNCCVRITSFKTHPQLRDKLDTGSIIFSLAPVPFAFVVLVNYFAVVTNWKILKHFRRTSGDAITIVVQPSPGREDNPDVDAESVVTTTSTVIQIHQNEL